MLRFLFGKSSRSQEQAPPPARPPARAEPAPPPVEVIPLARRLEELAARPDGDPGILEAALASGPAEWREAALARIQEPALLARVACEGKSADGRHAAVLRVSDEALLAQIAQQVKSRDKRVYKVARDRLDGFARERERHALQARWLETVEALAAQEHPELSRVMEVERVWAALQPDADADARFQQARARLHARFQAQAEERRQARRQDVPLAERSVSGGAEATTGAPAASDVAAADGVGSVAGGTGAMPGGEGAVARHGAAGESEAAGTGASGGAHGGVAEGAEGGTAEGAQGGAAALAAGATVAGASLPEGSAALERSGALASGAGSGASASPSEASASPSGTSTVDLAAGEDPGAARKPAAAARRKVELDPALRDRIASEIEALEHALEDGHLHDAETRLATLSELQSQAGGVAGPLGSRIRRAVEEIARLRAWRRWGGQQARDHLVEAAEALPSRELPPEELGRAIKALRAQWQSIASSEGGAPQSLWERFDAACERAWEPVREHFARQAERRAGNLQRREAMLAELEARVAALDAPPVDWKAAAFALVDVGRRWQTLGPVDRKVAKTLEARFAAATGTLERRVRTVREAEAAEREALIRRAEQLSERLDSRDVVTRLRELQAEWQTRSRAVPLERAREQALWERFRSACDSLFQARDAARAAEEAERTAQAELEAAAFRKRSELWRGLREAALACSQAEQQLAAGIDLASAGPALLAQLQTAWQALPEISGRDAAPVQVRHQRLVAVCEGRETLDSILAGFQAASAQLAQGLLELEIGLGLQSPPEVQEARRRLQLARLADALRSGGRSDHDGLRRPALALCALPASSAALAQRLDAVLGELAPRPPERRPAPTRPAGAGRGAEGESRGRRGPPDRPRGEPDKRPGRGPRVRPEAGRSEARRADPQHAEGAPADSHARPPAAAPDRQLDA